MQAMGLEVRPLWVYGCEQGIGDFEKLESHSGFRPVKTAITMISVTNGKACATCQEVLASKIPRTKISIPESSRRVDSGDVDILKR